MTTFPASFDAALAARLLLAASAAIVLALGSLHLLFTFSGPRFDPREPALKLQMQAVAPMITRETTMWRCWVGFNASHSLGAMLFGAVYGYLAWQQQALLASSPFLLVLGALVLVAFVALARAYWFRIPLRGLSLSLVLYVAGVALLANGA